MLGWKLVRFAEMCLAAWLGYLLARRLGASFIGSCAGSVVLLASPAAAVSWSRMSVFEPTGTMLLLLLALTLFGVPQSLGTTSRALIAAGLVSLMGLFKEMFLFAVPPLVLGIWLYGLPGRPTLAAFFRDRINQSAAAGAIVTVIPAVWVALRAPPDSYAKSFGSGSQAGQNFAMTVLTTLIPFSPTELLSSAIGLTALSLYVFGVVGGWGLILRSPRRAGATGILSLGIMLPLLGAAAYAPWPSYHAYYALPFLVGPMLLLALAASELADGHGLRRFLALAGLLIVSAPMFTFAHGYSRRVSASVRLARETAEKFGSLPEAATIRFEVCAQNREPWGPEFGALLQRYATTLSLTSPQVIDVACRGTGGDPDAGSPDWRFVLSDHLEPRFGNTLISVYTHSSFSLSSLRVSTDSVIVAVLPPTS